MTLSNDLEIHIKKPLSGKVVSHIEHVSQISTMFFQRMHACKFVEEMLHTQQILKRAMESISMGGNNHGGRAGEG